MEKTKEEIQEMITDYLDKVENYSRTLTASFQKSELLGREIESIPGYKSLEIGEFKKANLAVMFIDMRNSTDIYFDYISRKKVEKLYLLVHAFLFLNTQIISTEFKGTVSEIPGDGVMAIFKADEFENDLGKAIQKAGMCGFWLQRIREEILNPILKEKEILISSHEIKMGIGIDAGEALITRIGMPEISKIHVMGYFVNNASKLANEDWNKQHIVFAPNARNRWPKGKEGKVIFKKSNCNNIYSKTEAYYLSYHEMEEVFPWQTSS